MYKCIAVFTIVAFQLLCRGAGASNLRVVEVTVFNGIMERVNGLSVAAVAELCVEAIDDVGHKSYSPFERCCLLNRMASLVFDFGFLKVASDVRRDYPNGGAKIVDSLLRLVGACEKVVELRYNALPGGARRSIAAKFKRILETQLVDNGRKLDEKMLTVCSDVDGLLLIQCARQFATVLLQGEMALCHGNGAGRCAETFYGESRRVYRPRNPWCVFPSSSLYGVVSSLGSACAAGCQASLFDTKLSDAVASFGRRYNGLADLLDLTWLPADVRTDVRIAVECCMRHRLHSAVFSGTQAAYDQSIGDVLHWVWSNAKGFRDWDYMDSANWGMGFTAKEEPLHRFWSWTTRVFNVWGSDNLDRLVAEAAVHCEEFDQIAFDHAAYGDYRLVFAWLVMREYAYRARGQNAEAPAIRLSPQAGESVFRLVRCDEWSALDVEHLLSMCLYLGGITWSSVQHDLFPVLRPMWFEHHKDLARVLELRRHPDPKRVGRGRF
jgi:hypothetical protein